MLKVILTIVCGIGFLAGMGGFIAGIFLEDLTAIATWGIIAIVNQATLNDLTKND